MIRRLSFACVLLVLGSGPAQAQVPYGQHLVPTRSALARVGLERHWMAAVPLYRTERVLAIGVADTLLFAQTNYGNLHAYDAESGQYLWTVDLGRPTGAASPASVNSYAVFITNANYLYALDRRSGRPIWTAELPALPTSPTACDEHRVMVGLQNGKVYAYMGRLQKIQVATPTGSREEIKPTPDIAWNWMTNGVVTGRPLPAGPVAAFGSSDSKVYVAQSEAPVMIYRFNAAGPVVAPLAGHGTRTLLIPSVDKNVYALDLWTAETKWIHSTGAPVETEPLVAGDDIYVVNSAGMLSSLDPNTGAARWIVPTHGGRLLSVGQSRVYLESENDDLFIVDRGTGQTVADPRTTFVRAGLNLREFTLGPTNRQNDRLYIGTPSGLLFAAREIGQLTPRLLRDPKAPPFGYVPPEGINLSPTPPPVKPGEAGTEAPAETPGEEKPMEEKPGEEKKEEMPKEDMPKEGDAK
ncbi:MAG: PQQ-binding-like beta-propeller repeat protein [Isosphaeraceae bacterium]|nr:PQQ-binding-like beta-propeller repeat protein [Isosphaeraceae bacterium]